MPSLAPPATVLVTGASGFIASHAVQALLDKGFKVVGTVRSASKGQYLEKLFGEKYPGKFSFVIVEDIAKEDAFDEAVKGVDAVEHTAALVNFTDTEPELFYGPAIKGTVGILKSVLKNGKSVKRVVITGSVASVFSPKNGPYVYTEADWNEYSPALVEEKGNKAPPNHLYSASKVLAEKAAWDFVETHKNEISWDLVMLLPSYVFGPTIHEVASISAIGGSNSFFISIVIGAAGASASQEVLSAPVGNLVDVRDVALAHVESLTNPSAGGERFIVSATAFTWQEVLDAINSETPTLKGVNKGFPGTSKNITTYTDGTKLTNVLGIRYRDIKTMGVDTVKDLYERFPQ